MRARPLALCGVLTALAVTLLCLGGVIPGAVFCAPILAMAVLLPVLGGRGASVYLFFGWYPILRPKIAALPSRPLRLLVRLAVCNIAALVLYGLVLRLMGLTADLLESVWYFNAALLAAGNLVFLLTDATLARLTNLWHWKLKKYLYR